MNPDNALALVISSSGLINAPKSAGGNPREAVRLLTQQSLRNDLDDIERFRTIITLSPAYKKLGEKQKAEDVCRQAAKIFPNNPRVENFR